VNTISVVKEERSFVNHTIRDVHVGGIAGFIGAVAGLTITGLAFLMAIHPQRPSDTMFMNVIVVGSTVGACTATSITAYVMKWLDGRAAAAAIPLQPERISAVPPQSVKAK